MIEKRKTVPVEETAVLVGLLQDNITESQLEEYLDELAFLTETAGAKAIKRFYQRLPRADSRTFVGSGKLLEIQAYVKAHAVTMVIFDDELSGAQINNIQKVLEVNVIDRSDLILDIFAGRARTAQARVQVELAQYQYLLPRLKGMWTHLERQGGGIGSRGPGETEIETDRRIVKDKISLLRKKLAIIDKQASTQRQERGELIRVALVGYTNVGKSTLMNLLSKSDVFAENKLFATLDTTTRKIVLDNTPFLLSDTVGFIRKLPVHLVKSFNSTLSEVKEADILLHVVDISHPFFEEQMATVNKTLQELEVYDKPVLTVFNKMDLYETQSMDQWLDPEVKKDLMNELYKKWQTQLQGNCVFVSASAKQNIDVLRLTLLAMVRSAYQVRYPYKVSFWGNLAAEES